MRNVYIVAAKRTPIGKFGKSLASIPAPELGARVIKHIVKETGVPAESIEEVIMGNVIQAGVGQNPAGQASSMAGLPDEVLKYTVNKVCSSGTLAVENATREIMLGERDLVVAGGMESMSNAPLMMPAAARWGVGQLLGRELKFSDSMLNDGLFDAFTGTPMGEYAEATGRKYGITRKEADEFSVRSQMLSAKAWESGEFAAETIHMDELARDEGLRPTTIESMSKLRAAFARDGILTAGNSSQLSDGASALMLASEEAVNQHSLKPIAEITGFQAASMSPEEFVVAPIPSARKLLQKLGKTIDYFDLVEHNEAFSVASLIIQKELGIEDSKFNVYGGAIALGHPLGNSGSRIIVTLLNALKQKKLEHGMITICHGGGGGDSLSVEMM